MAVAGEGCATLARGFKEDDGACSGNVQRIDATGHGDAEQVIAGAANEIVQTGSFASEDNYRVGREVEAVVILGAALVEADDPEIVLFEGFQRTDEVDDACEAEVLGGSRGGFDGDSAEGGGAALGEKDAIDAGAFGGAEERAEVLGIFNAIEGEDETGGGAAARSREEVFEIEEVALADDGDDALVSGGLGEAAESVAGLGAKFHPGGAAEGGEGGQAGILTAAKAFGGDADVIEAARAGAKGLFDGMETVQNLHRFFSLSLPELLNGLILGELPGEMDEPGSARRDGPYPSGRKTRTGQRLPQGFVRL